MHALHIAYMQPTGQQELFGVDSGAFCFPKLCFLGLLMLN